MEVSFGDRTCSDNTEVNPSTDLTHFVSIWKGNQGLVESADAWAQTTTLPLYQRKNLSRWVWYFLPYVSQTPPLYLILQFTHKLLKYLSLAPAPLNLRTHEEDLEVVGSLLKENTRSREEEERQLYAPNIIRFIIQLLLAVWAALKLNLC
jgi:hypothetical protein